jgi:Heterokaryon incompatibility protein (HET)
MDVASQEPSASENLQQSTEQDNEENVFYSTLKDTDEIRLLHLHPRNSGEAICCTLNHVSLSSRPDYEALSYAWGPKTIQTEHSIIIDNKNFCVRDNLWVALQHLRLETEVRVLWIDAICINQKETRERNHQVSQMGNIFNNARRVVVWLGAADDTSTRAFRVLSHPGQGRDFIVPSNDPMQIEEGNRKLNLIYSILTRNYWTRL